MITTLKAQRLIHTQNHHVLSCVQGDSSQSAKTILWTRPTFSGGCECVLCASCRPAQKHNMFTTLGILHKQRSRCPAMRIAHILFALTLKSNTYSIRLPKAAHKHQQQPASRRIPPCRIPSLDCRPFDWYLPTEAPRPVLV